MKFNQINEHIILLDVLVLFNIRIDLNYTMLYKDYCHFEKEGGEI
jgi:hypothetical protein